MSEIWKDIKGYEGLYQVSNLGRVKSLPRFIERSIASCFTKEKILKTFVLKGGYVNIVLRKGGKSCNHNIHRLVAETFIENNNTEFSCVNHIDGDKQNNNADNLEWCNHSINCLHAFKTGLSKKDSIVGDDNKNSKITSDDVRMIRSMARDGIDVEVIRSRFNLSRNYTQKIIRKGAWSHIK